MAMLAMDREPEMARFIDTYKFDQDMSVKRDKFGGGTSLPLTSDGYEDKQQKLKDERHQDWMQQQEKPRDPVYYRVGTPEQGFPGLGTYDKQRQQHNVVRQKEYNDLLRKQRESERQKYEARRTARAQPAQPQGPQMDYNVSQEQARAEERRAYQDYMKSKEERYWQMRGRPVTPAGGLNIGNYDRQVKEQAAQKKKDYKEMLDQQKADQLKLRAFDHMAELSPSHVNYREEERPLVGSPRDFNYPLHEQQREHMYLRARQEPEVAVLDRSGPPAPFLANKPPPGPGYRPREEAFRTEPNRRPIPERPRHGQPPYHGERDQEGEKTVHQAVEQSQRSQQPPPPLSPDKSKFNRQGSPQKSYNNSFAIPPQDDGYENRQRSPQKAYNLPDQPQERGNYERQRSPERPMQDRSPDRSRPPDRSFGSERPRTPPEWLSQNANTLQKPVAEVENYGTPLAFKTQPYNPAPQPGQQIGRPQFSRDGQPGPYMNGFDGPPQRLRSRDGDAPRQPANVDSTQVSPRRTMNTQYADSEDVTVKRKEANAERKKEYNDYLRLKSRERHQQEDARHAQMGKPTEMVKNPYYSSDDYEKFQRDLQKKQGEEYREFLSKQYQPPSGEGLPLGQYKYEPKRLAMEAERNKEYNELLKKKSHETRNRDWNYDKHGVLELRGDDAQQSKARELRAERQKDYNSYISQQKATHPARRTEFGDPSQGPYNGLFLGLGEHGNNKDVLNQERRREYNEKLDQNVERSTRSPMRNPAPPDQYQQMLDEKRREEASRRRYEDPEYQDRLAQGRGEAPRYGY